MTKPVLPAPTTFSGFERGLRTLWAGGKGASDEVGAYLAHLPQEPSALAKFVGENLSDDFLETLVQAAETSLPTADAVALLAKTSALRRFDMGWMMAGSKAKAAAARVFKAAAAQPSADLGAAEITAVAKKFDCKA